MPDKESDVIRAAKIQAAATLVAAMAERPQASFANDWRSAYKMFGEILAKLNEDIKTEP